MKERTKERTKEGMEEGTDGRRKETIEGLAKKRYGVRYEGRDGDWKGRVD